MSSDTLTTISPITNQPILTRSSLKDSEIQTLSSNATSAFLQWKTTPFEQRLAIVTKALGLLAAKESELARELTEQMGRPIAYTGVEIKTAVKRGEYLCKIAKEALADTPGETEAGFKRYIRKVPVGPVLIIFAWNYPYLILINSLIPALLAGNSVLLKPSPQTPTIAEHFSALFTTAGLPPHVIQYFHSGSPTQLQLVARSPAIKHICFTGSVAGGLAVKASVSDSVSVGVGLELGGKDAAYIRDDVDVAWAAGEIVDGAVFNSGQSCCSVERVYVAAAIYDAFVAAVQDVLRGYVLGDPFDAKTQLGPVVSARSADAIRAHVADALAKGARDVTPENATFASLPTEGNYVAPVVLVDVTHDMLVMTEETFGPVIPIMKVASDAEAVKLMNDSQFGLTASIWTKDVTVGEQLSEEIEAGTVFVNRCDFPSPDLAWTGVKLSGKGQTLSRFGFDQFTVLKSFHVKDYPK